MRPRGGAATNAATAVRRAAGRAAGAAPANALSAAPSCTTYAGLRPAERWQLGQGYRCRWPPGQLAKVCGLAAVSIAKDAQ